MNEQEPWTVSPWGAEIDPLWPSDVIVEFVQRAGVDLPTRIMEIAFCSDLRRLNVRVVPKAPPHEHKWLVFSPEGARLILSPHREMIRVMRHWTRKFFAQAIDPLPDDMSATIRRLPRWSRLAELCLDETEYYLEPDEVDDRDVYWNSQLDLWVSLLAQYGPIIDRVWQLFGIPPIASTTSRATTTPSTLPPWCLAYLHDSFKVHRPYALALSLSSCSPSAATPATAASATSTSSSCDDAKSK